ncbi:MAG: hypothetical protein QOH18_1237, partial [Solirubrobacterales bacterium]|nr:hypothetical protein [Solirubrobacterales bacterium]
MEPVPTVSSRALRVRVGCPKNAKPGGCKFKQVLVWEAETIKGSTPDHLSPAEGVEA